MAAGKRGTSGKKAGTAAGTRGKPSTATRPRGKPSGEGVMEVRDSTIHGKGVFALVDIAEGTRVCEYVGERIAPEEADERYDDDRMEHHHTFLFTVDEGTIVDGARYGNDARYINHSCTPNCRSAIEEGRIYIDALEDIPAGTELTYDYRLERPGRWQQSWYALYACRCGAPNCRGTMMLRTPRRRSRKK